MALEEVEATAFDLENFFVFPDGFGFRLVSVSGRRLVSRPELCSDGFVAYEYDGLDASSLGLVEGSGDSADRERSLEPDSGREDDDLSRRSDSLRGIVAAGERLYTFADRSGSRPR